MPLEPELDEFVRASRALAEDPLLGPHISGHEIHLRNLTLDEVARLAKSDVAYYFLIAAAGLNRTSIKKAMDDPAAKIVQKTRRRAFVIRERLPERAPFQAIVQQSVALRSADLGRKRRGAVESLFRERLAAEGIPLVMSPPIRHVPAVLIPRRKPDGVYPDPGTGSAPQVYLEIKSIRRVADDIQKRLYELAETAIEMKTLYGNLRLEGFDLRSTKGVEADPTLRAKLRDQIIATGPVVVAFLICSREEAARYREGAEAFVDRVFFQEEIDECLAFLRSTIAAIDHED